MSMTSLGLLEGATLSATGGTAITYTPANGGAIGQLYLANASEEDFRLRETIQAKAVIPSRQSDGSWSKDRRNVTLVVPVHDVGTGEYENITFRLERVAPVFATTAQKAAAGKLAAQFIFDNDTESFWNAGSYA